MVHDADRDDAGDAAAGKLAKKLTGKGIECFRIQFPKGMDANAYGLSVSSASKSLGVAIRSAAWLGKEKAPAVTTSPAPMMTTETIAPVAETTGEEQTPLAADEAPVRASPLPAAPCVDVDAEAREQEVVLRFGDRRWRDEPCSALDPEATQQIENAHPVATASAVLSLPFYRSVTRWAPGSSSPCLAASLHEVRGRRLVNVEPVHIAVCPEITA